MTTNTNEVGPVVILGDSDNTPDRVIIRAFKSETTGRYKDSYGKFYLDAFLPDCHANIGYIVCYGRVSENFNGYCHGEASLEYYKESRKVNYDLPEVKALVAELQSLGYNVSLRQRLSRPFGGWAK